MPAVVAIIPLYNHGATVLDVVRAVQAAGLDVIVVDDGSTDGGDHLVAEHFAQHSGGRLILSRRNRGKAHALLVGMEAARATGASHALTIDADGQHDTGAIPRFLESIRGDPVLVLGDRRPIPSTYPLARLCGRTLSGLAVRAACGQSVGDAACGMRVYPIREVLDLRCVSGRYAWEEEAIIRLAWGGVRIRQVKIPVIYPSRAVARSHYRFGRDWPEGIAILLLCVLMRVLGISGAWHASRDAKRQTLWPFVRSAAAVEVLLLACFTLAVGAILAALAAVSQLGPIALGASSAVVLIAALRTCSPLAAAALGAAVGCFAAPLWALVIVVLATATGLIAIARQRDSARLGHAAERRDLIPQPPEKLGV
jgi:hypothetical protein